MEGADGVTHRIYVAYARVAAPGLVEDVLV